MKKILLLLALVLIGAGSAFSQSTAGEPSINGVFFTPGSGGLGCNNTFAVGFGNTIVNTEIPIGGITVYVSGPPGATPAYKFTAAAPTGSSLPVMNWTYEGANNTWVGVNTAPLIGGTNYDATFSVQGLVISASPIITTTGVLVNPSWITALNNTANDIVNQSTTVSSVCTSITVSPLTQNIQQGQTGTLTATGCSGTVTWSPAGVGGVTTGTTLSVPAPTSGVTTTYTATCSTGGTASASVTGIPAACAANAGTLN